MPGISPVAAPAVLTPMQRIDQAFDELAKGPQARIVPVDSLALKPAQPVVLPPGGKVPMGTAETILRKSAVVGTIAGGMALTSYACWALLAGASLPVAAAVVGAGVLANLAMGALAWGLLKMPLTK